MTTVTARYVRPHHLLGRHVNHDTRNRLYPYPTEHITTLTSVRHQRMIPVLDQGQLGSCTGNAAVGALGTAPLYAAVSQLQSPRYTLDESGAVALYSDTTRTDPFPGEYPPTDTGSDGPSTAKTLKTAGMISGYQHTFSLDDALRALTETSLMLGIDWTSDMFNPDENGVIHPTGTLEGGHEIVADELDVERELVGLTNSWTPLWGLAGRCYLSFTDVDALLSRGGDVTVLLSPAAPAPQPTPTPDPAAADAALAAAVRHDGWVRAHHVGDNARVAHAAATWLAAHPEL